jgi:hypothetical protein
MVLVDTAYAPWKQKYLARDGCCRIYGLPSTELHPDMLRPAPARRLCHAMLCYAMLCYARLG